MSNITSCVLQGVHTISNPKCINGIIADTCTCPPAEFVLARLFPDVNELPQDFFGFVQLVWLFIFYAIILYQGSNLISDGSELLLLIPEYISSELVGSIVLPILGAVPDGAIVLFSGLGPGAQEQLNVGIGGLAGSTIMLLTIPWFLSILAGRVDTNTKGIPKYKKGGKRLSSSNTICSMGTSGVAPKQRNMILSGRIMFATACIYLVIQIPAFILVGDGDDTEEVAKGESGYALCGTILSIVFFCIYLWFQAKLAEEGEHHSSESNVAKTVALQEKAIENGSVSLAAFLSGGNPQGRESNSNYSALEESSGKSNINPATETMLRSCFKKYDNDGDGEMSEKEMSFMLKDLGIKFASEDLHQAYLMIDIDGDGSVQFDEFLNKIQPVVSSLVAKSKEVASTAGSVNYSGQQVDGGNDDDDDGEEEDDDEPEIPEDLEDLRQSDPKAFSRSVLFRSVWMMFLGTAMVLLFSDPMVDVFSAFGDRMNISAFYVSFVLAPLASNASELIAAYNYAQKKTSTTITTSLTALQGAACMNNTFCLGIFMALIYFKQLYWEFSAETIVIVFIQFIMVIYSFKKYHYMSDAWAVLALYPLSLVLVWFLENVLHMP